MLQAFGYISAVLSIVMVVPYIRDIFRLKTKPERASWFIWSVLGFIAFASQFAEGATNSLWLTVGQTVAVLAVFILSLKYGMGGLAKRDIKALIVAGLGLVLWYLTDVPAYALLFVLIVDISGSILTILKSYERPETETISTYLISGTSGIFGLLAVGEPDFVLMAYPLYILVINYVIAGTIVLGKINKTTQIP